MNAIENLMKELMEQKKLTSEDLQNMLINYGSNEDNIFDIMSEETKPNYGSNENKLFDIMSDIIGQENKANGGRIGFQEGGTDRELELLKFYLDEGLDLEAAQDMVKSALAGEQLAKGGRVGLQEGGDAIPKSEYQIALERLRETQSALPKDSISVQQKSPGIEALLETYGPELANLLKTPIRPGGLEGVYGSFLPEIAAQDAAQTQAYNLAVAQATGGPGGLGAYTPFINQATQAANLQQQAATQGQNVGQQSIQNALNQANLAGLAAIQGQGAGQAGITSAQNIANQMQQAAVAGQQAAQPFLQAAQQFSGPQAFDQFMSPYQEQVIDSTREELQRELDRQQAQLGAAAVQSGAFGGGRFGVAQGELAAQGAQGIASTLANLKQQGFQQAQQSAAQALAQQIGLGTAAQQQAMANLGLFGQGIQGQLAGSQAAQQQAGQNVGLFGAAGQQQLGVGSGLMQQAGQNVGLAGQALQGQAGLASLQPQLAAQNVGLLGQFGQQQQLQQQAIIDAQKQGAKMIAYEPYDRFGFFGGQLTGIMGGYPGGVSFSSQMQQTPNAFQQILGGLGTVAGIGLGAKQAGFFG